MSYCRCSKGSDVYAYSYFGEDNLSMVSVSVCSITSRPMGYEGRELIVDRKSALALLIRLKDIGYKVPDGAITRLAREITRDDPEIRVKENS